ncbi:MAG: ATP-binding protein [Candidatus Micrarchaeia archaeon]
MAARDFLFRPPEPSPGMLLSPPSESVYIGKTKYLNAPFFWNSRKLLNPHLCVVGTTGSGKSYFVKTFITRASLALGASALILDWAGEYSDWVRSAGGRVVCFGKEGINLLDLAGSPPHARMGQVMGALRMLTDISGSSAQCRLTEDAIEEAYVSAGFTMKKIPCGKRKPPTLEDVQRILGRGGRRSADSAEAARRIKSLLLSSGGSFTASTLPLSSLLSGLVCVDLHSLPNETLRSLAGLSILQFVKERMRASAYSANAPPRLFVVVDEAWKIAADERSDVVSIVREGRKYGFGLIVASQNPTDVHKSIFSNAGTMVLFRLTHAPERNYVRSSLAYSDFYEEESHSLSVGQALVHLEFSSPSACPRNFILRKVDGEELLVAQHIRGDGMDLEFERGELFSKLLSFGLADAQTRAMMSEFERHSFSLEASEFASILEKFGYSRASAISLLRELGASERELLCALSPPGRQSGEAIAIISEESHGGKAPGKARKRR